MSKYMKYFYYVSPEVIEMILDYFVISDEYIKYTGLPRFLRVVFLIRHSNWERCLLNDRNIERKYEFSKHWLYCNIFKHRTISGYFDMNNGNNTNTHEYSIKSVPKSISIYGLEHSNKIIKIDIDEPCIISECLHENLKVLKIKGKCRLMSYNNKYVDLLKLSREYDISYINVEKSCPNLIELDINTIYENDALEEALLVLKKLKILCLRMDVYDGFHIPNNIELYIGKRDMPYFHGIQLYSYNDDTIFINFSKDYKKYNKRIYEELINSKIRKIYIIELMTWSEERKEQFGCDILEYKGYTIQNYWIIKRDNPLLTLHT
jgi:hypothetical protein